MKGISCIKKGGKNMEGIVLLVGKLSVVLVSMVGISSSLSWYHTESKGGKLGGTNRPKRSVDHSPAGSPEQRRRSM